MVRESYVFEASSRLSERGAGDIVLALSARRRRAPKNTTLGAQRAVWPSRDPGRSHSSIYVYVDSKYPGRRDSPAFLKDVRY